MPILLSQSDGAAFFAGRHFMFVPIETPSILPRRRSGGSSSFLAWRRKFLRH